MLLKDQMQLIEKHQQEAPVHAVPIANALGLEVYKVPGWPKDISGMIRADKDMGGTSGYAIFVNADHHERRRRFTIAHEIAHYVLHKSFIGDGIVEDALLRADGLTNKLEAQANKMAADILMPWHLIRDYQEQGLRSIEELATQFNVSNDAMSIRLLGVSYERAREAMEVS